MSTNEMMVGRRARKITWPDDTQIEQGEDGCLGLLFVETGNSDVWIMAEYETSRALINTHHLAMIEFEE